MIFVLSLSNLTHCYIFIRSHRISVLNLWSHFLYKRPTVNLDLTTPTFYPEYILRKSKILDVLIFHNKIFRYNALSTECIYKTSHHSFLSELNVLQRDILLIFNSLENMKWFHLKQNTFSSSAASSTGQISVVSVFFWSLTDDTERLFILFAE